MTSTPTNVPSGPPNSAFQTSPGEHAGTGATPSGTTPVQATQTPAAQSLASLLPAILTTAFTTALVVWVTWFWTHLPWLKVPEPVALSTILGVWIIAAGWTASAAPWGGRWRVGILSGITAAVIGLLILGSKLTQMPTGEDTGGVASAVAMRPSAGLMALGFVTLGGVVGLVGTALSTVFRREQAGIAQATALDWTARFAIVAAVAMTPLLFIGGLVTSTNSGMAVPDWPNTYGTNMFLFPLGPRAAANVYLEHTHRLFGTLVGLTSFTLLVMVLRYEIRPWVKAWAIGVFLLVCLQGVLGGIRVLFGSDVIGEDNRVLSMLHGISGQVVFAAGVALAVFLARTYRTLTPAAVVPQRSQTVLRIVATAVLHTTFIQLALGAAWRHLRVTHALWTHIVLAFGIFFAALLAGIFARSTPEQRRDLARAIRLSGMAVLLAGCLQFSLGWISLIVGGLQPQADNLRQTLILTSHQANGAVFIAAITALAVWTKKAARTA